MQSLNKENLSCQLETHFQSRSLLEKTKEIKWEVIKEIGLGAFFLLASTYSPSKGFFSNTAPLVNRISIFLKVKASIVLYTQTVLILFASCYRIFLSFKNQSKNTPLSQKSSPLPKKKIVACSPKKQSPKQTKKTLSSTKTELPLTKTRLDNSETKSGNTTTLIPFEDSEKEKVTDVKEIDKEEQKEEDDVKELQNKSSSSSSSFISEDSEKEKVNNVKEAENLETEQQFELRLRSSLDTFFVLEKKHAFNAIEKLVELALQEKNAFIEFEKEAASEIAEQDNNHGYNVYDLLISEDIQQEQLSIAALKDIQESNRRISNIQEKGEISPDDFLEIEELKKKMPTWILLWKFSEKLEQSLLNSLKTDLLDFSNGEPAYKEKDFLDPSAIDEKWENAPPELKNLAKQIAEEGLTNTNREIISCFLEKNAYNYWHSTECDFHTDPDLLNPGESPYSHTEDCSKEQEKLKNIQWFFLIFKSDRFEHFAAVRKEYGHHLFMNFTYKGKDLSQLWLSTKEKIERLNPDRQPFYLKPLLKASAYHSTRTIESMLMIAQSCIKVNARTTYAGAFTSTLMEDEFGYYTFGFKTAIQFSSLTENFSHCDPSQTCFWIGGCSEIPVNTKTLSCVLINNILEEDSVKKSNLIKNARRICAHLKRKTGKIFPCYFSTTYDNLLEQKQQAGLVNYSKNPTKRITRLNPFKKKT